jgi:ppGpp synthetase/RelA/SpoT-type nucleotidyltranferase
MAYSKGEVNRAGIVIAENKTPTTPDEVDRLGSAVEVVEWWRGEHSAPLNTVAANLGGYVALVSELPVSQRLKRLPTIAGKLTRLPTMKLATMGDIGGVRAVVPNQDAAHHVANRLRENWSIARFSDYVAPPKADGYRALHLINQHDGRLIEVQIRTPLQDEWANSVEILSRSVVPDLKFGNGPVELRQMLAELASIYAELEAGGSSLDAVEAKFGEIDSTIATLKEATR